MFPAAECEIAPDVNRERIKKLKYIHPMEQNRTEEWQRVSNQSSLTIFPSTAIGMNGLIGFSPFRIKRLKVPED